MNRKSYVLAALIALGLVAWMLSGQLGGDPGSAEAPEERAPEPMAVQVRTLEAEPVRRRLESQGEVLADQDVQLRAEAAGRVEEVLVRRGARVEEGEPLLRLATNDREARRAQARARVAQREAEYAAARRLGDDGYQSRTAVQEALAALETARAELSAIEEEIDDLTIRAPFDGVLEEREPERGDYLAVGDAVARVVNRDPLLAVVDIAQQDIGEVEEGREAQIELATGARLEGRVTYISGSAAEGTRTFRVEVEAANPEDLPAGVSATVRIPLDEVQAHFLSPAVLALDESGELGVKTVDDEERVRFRPVEVVRAERDGIWVSGLPERARVITLGQGFVRDGEEVRAVAEEDVPEAGRARPDPPAAATALEGE